MPVGVEVGLSPGDFVLDGDPAPHPPKKKTAHSRICRGPRQGSLQPFAAVQTYRWWKGEYPLTKNPIPLGHSNFAYRSFVPRHFRGLTQCCRRLSPVKLCIKRAVGKNKSSAVAEMGDRGHSRHGPKRGGGLLCPLSVSWDPV